MSSKKGNIIIVGVLYWSDQGNWFLLSVTCYLSFIVSRSFILMDLTYILLTNINCNYYVDILII